jgi:hypothetical protein
MWPNEPKSELAIGWDRRARTAVKPFDPFLAAGSGCKSLTINGELGVAFPSVSDDPAPPPIQPSELAFAFIRLGNGTQDDLLECARRIGPLGFCEPHHKPFSRVHECRKHLVDDSAFYPTVWESRPLWIAVSGTFNCALSIGTRLVQGLSVRDADLATLERACAEWRPGVLPDADRPGLVVRQRPPSWPWDIVCHFLNYFNVYRRTGNLHQGWEMSADGSRHFAISLSAGDPLGVIALGVGTILASERGAIVCMNCHAQFPRSGRAKYCERCRRLGLGKASRRRERRREKAHALLIPVV